MFDTITIALVPLTLLALTAAVFTIVSQSRVKRNLSELGMRVLESQDIGKIKEAANKTESFESRMSAWEHKGDENKNKLEENKTKLNELADKLETVKQIANKNEDGLSQTIPNIKALADEIQNLKIFQKATEKARSLILGALADIQAGMSPEESLGTMPEETSQGPEEWQKETKVNKISGSRPWKS